MTRVDPRTSLLPIPGMESLRSIPSRTGPSTAGGVGVGVGTPILTGAIPIGMPTRPFSTGVAGIFTTAAADTTVTEAIRTGAEATEAAAIMAAEATEVVAMAADMAADTAESS